MRTFLRIALWHQHVSAVIKTTILRATQLFPCSVGKGLKTFIIFLRAVFKLAVCLSLPHEYQNIRFLLLHSNSVIRPDVVSDHFIVQEESSGYLKPTLSRVVVNNSVCECAASAEFDELRGVSVCCLLVWPTMANESNKRMLGGKKQKQKNQELLSVQLTVLFWLLHFFSQGIVSNNAWVFHESYHIVASRSPLVVRNYNWYTGQKVPSTSTLHIETHAMKLLAHSFYADVTLMIQLMVDYLDKK